jgi:hypothetical protein
MADENDRSTESGATENTDREEPIEEVASGAPELTTDPVPEEDRPAVDMPPSKPAPPAENDEPIVPGSLRVDPQVGRELFGAHYNDITARGPAMFGNDNLQVIIGQKERLDPYVGHLDYVSELIKVHAGTESDKRLTDLLGQRAIVCLIGPKNSGRFSSACTALGEIYGHERVNQITLPAGVGSDALFETPELIAEESGFVLRYDRDNYAEAMRRLSDLFRRRGSGLLFIRDEGTGGGVRGGAEVDHQPPDPTEVFRNHVGRRLVFLDTAFSYTEIDKYLRFPSLRDALAKTYGPKECVAIAEAVAKSRPDDDEAMQTTLDSSQPRRRKLAAEILMPTKDGVGTGGRRASQHERAFRISYAVFRRQPLHYVFEAAEWLLAEIDSAALRPEWGSMALQRSVDELLGEPLAKEWRAGRDAGNTALGAARVAWMRDPGLRGAILDVAWHEFDSTRKPLLKWLNKLVDDGDEVMSRAASETAGLLAHYDFDYVHRELLGGWARSPRRQMRQAAARSEMTAEMAGDVGDRIRETLRGWCLVGNNYQRDTAALVYASGLQQPVLAWSLSDLGLIADNKIQLRSDAIAEAVNQLYRPEAAKLIIRVLAQWTRRTHARVHAARALLALAQRPSSDVVDLRPELLMQFAGGGVDADDLARLWRVALSDSILVLSAAGVLAGWVRLADDDPELRTHVQDLVARMAPRPAMRRQVVYYLEKQPEFRDGLPDWVSRMEGSES